MDVYAVHVGPLEVVVERDVLDGELLEVAQLHAEGDRIFQRQATDGRFFTLLNRISTPVYTPEYKAPRQLRFFWYSVSDWFRLSMSQMPPIRLMSSLPLS